MRRKLILICCISVVFQFFQVGCKKEKDSYFEIRTYEVTNFNDAEAVFGGELKCEGDYEITEVGICWSINPEPTIDNSLIYCTEKVSSFKLIKSHLIPETKYYVRVFVKVDGEIKYGNEVSFTTLKLFIPDILIGLNSGTALSSNLGAFVAKSVTGNQTWLWDNVYSYSTIDGFDSNTYWDNDDWLISPTIDMTERGDSVYLTFDHAGKYFNNNIDEKVSVWISTTSDGTVENFNALQWNQLSINNYPIESWTLVPVNIKLRGYNGKNNVHIAFRYISNASDGYAGTWHVNNVYIYEYKKPLSLK